MTPNLGQKKYKVSLKHFHTKRAVNSEKVTGAILKEFPLTKRDSLNIKVNNGANEL